MPAASVASGPPVAAIMLAGGHGRRLGGADKPALRIGGRSLAASVAGAAAAVGAARIVVVGLSRPGLVAEIAAQAGADGRADVDVGGRAGPVSIKYTSEEPPGSGPVPALVAGLGLVTEQWVLLLAADLPFLTGDHLRELLAAARAPLADRAAPDRAAPGGAVAGGSGAVLADDHGVPQWLSSCWPAASLRAALARYEGTSLRGVLGSLPHALVTATIEDGQPPYWLDCDTPADLEAAAHWARA